MKAVITCQYGTNKGDRAICEYLLNILTQNGYSVTISTRYPRLWAKYKAENVDIIGFGYPTFTVNGKSNFTNRALNYVARKIGEKILFPQIMSGEKKLMCRVFSKKYIQNISEADIVVVTGGHHITSLRNRNALFDVTYDMGLIRLYAKKYVLWTQTIGPLSFDNEEARKYFQEILDGASTVYVRDRSSIDVLNNCFDTTKMAIHESIDTVFGYANIVKPIEYSKRDKTVGISIFNGLPKARCTYKYIAKIIDYFVTKGYKIKFFRMEYNDREVIDIKDIIDMTISKPEYETTDFLTSAVDHINAVNRCKYFIGYKTHSVIIALTTATPLLAFSYHKKTYEFMEMFNQQDMCIDDEDISEQKVLEKVKELFSNGDEIHKQLVTTSKIAAEKVYRDAITTFRCNK